MFCEEHPYTCVPLRMMAGGREIKELTQHVRVDVATWWATYARRAA